jgi:alanine racemase
MSDNSNVSWFEVSLGALQNNIRNLRLLLTNQKFGAVLKANAYGHGLQTVLQAVHADVDIFFVVLVSDGKKIREYELTRGIERKRIVVIGSIVEAEIEDLIDYELEAAIADDSWIESIKKLRFLKKKIKAHVFLESGLYREGFEGRDITVRYDFLKHALDVIEPIAAYSHFANTEDVTEQAYAKAQIKKFHDGVKILSDMLEVPNKLELHFAASAAAMLLPESRLDIARFGIALYGYWPSQETRLSSFLQVGGVQGKSTVELEACLSWKCKSQLIKLVQNGSYVGYGCTYKCTKPTFIAIFPVGYFDGYPRACTAKAHVLIENTRCPVIGRVMMNHIIVDATCVPEIEKKKEVIAVLLGQNGQEVFENSSASADSITVEMFSSWAQTIPYEIVARFPGHLIRKLVS